MAAPGNHEVILELKGISKTFPGVRALNDVNFELRRGEVHALVGENGAGKSTLIKLLAGVFLPTEGEMYYGGEKVTVRNPGKGIDLGISVIYQEFNLVPHISVAKNIFLGREPRRKGLPFLIDYRKLHKDAEEIIRSFGTDLDVRTHVARLGVAHMQLVEMAKAFSVKASVLVMDEPTAALSDREIQRLFQYIREFKKKGISIIYISHRMEEIFEIADRVTVLRDGNVVKTMKTEEVENLDELIRLMVGREASSFFERDFSNEKGETALEVRGLSRSGHIENVDLHVRAGEIVGLAGLVGCGRTKLARIIYGADSHDSGEVRLFGLKSAPAPARSVSMGMAFIPEDRKEEGLALILPVRENVVMAGLKKLFPRGLINPMKESAVVCEFVKTLRIATPSILRATKFLSGGNQQKVILAKWLCTRAKIFIFDEPTRGIDVGAKAEIHHLMNQLVKEGAAVLMISSDLPEVLHMSDRVYVMKDGRIVKELAREQADQETVLRYAMAGV